jgi:hypothetical protein
MPEEPNTAAQPTSEKFDFDSVYANNSFFEASAWDLKVIIGQLEQHTGEAKIDWHTAVTMAWPAAKVFAYFLRLNIKIHELKQGAISVPKSVIPEIPLLPADADETVRKIHEYAKALHVEMFGAS